MVRGPPAGAVFLAAGASAARAFAGAGAFTAAAVVARAVRVPRAAFAGTTFAEARPETTLAVRVDGRAAAAFVTAFFAAVAFAVAFAFAFAVAFPEGADVTDFFATDFAVAEAFVAAFAVADRDAGLPTPGLAPALFLLLAMAVSIGVAQDRGKPAT